MATVLAILGAILVADAVFRVYAVRVAQPIFETPPPFHVERHPVDSAAEVMRIPVGPDRTLAAALFFPETSPDGRGARGVVVFCPELGSDRWSAPAYCRGLLDLGYLVLAFDFRGQGESDPGPEGHRPHHWLTEVEVTDVLAAVERTARDERLAGLPLTLFGVSRGAGGGARGGVAVVRGAGVLRGGRWSVLGPDDDDVFLPPLGRVVRAGLASQAAAAVACGVDTEDRRVVQREEEADPVRACRTGAPPPQTRTGADDFGERDSYVLPRFTLRLQRMTDNRRNGRGSCRAPSTTAIAGSPPSSTIVGSSNSSRRPGARASPRTMFVDRKDNP